MTLVKFNRQNNLLFPKAKAFFDEFFNDSFFDEFFNDSFSRFPAVNVIEDEQKFNLELSVPGFKKEDFKINLENNVITISGEFSENNVKKEKNYTKREFTHRNFSRSFNLPENANIDEITASYENGILNIVIPKTNVVKNVRQINID